MGDFTVVMPCYLMHDGHVELTKNAVASFGDVELIVVDDGSRLGGGYLRSIADTYVLNKENSGYGKSVNKGLKLASTRYIAIANNDIRISPNWQEVTREVFENERAYSCHFRQIDYNEPFRFGDKTFYTGKERWCHASFFVIDTAKEKYLYDEHFVNTYDDWDYFFNVRKNGYQQAYTDKAAFQHVHSATIPYMDRHTDRNTENAEYFKQKNGDYAENLFAQEFPEQMKQDYLGGFSL